MIQPSKSIVKLGYQEYCGFPPDGRRHEIVDGDHYVNPAPNTYHQTLSMRIAFQLYSQIEVNGLGRVFHAPTDLQLSDHDVVQPDLLVVLSDKEIIITPTKIKGVPDLIVEILSDSTKPMDLGLKKELYLRAEVPEYWIVDPEDHVVEQYTLQGQDYSLVGRHEQEVVFQGLKDVTVNLAQVW